MSNSRIPGKITDNAEVIDSSSEEQISKNNRDETENMDKSGSRANSVPGKVEEDAETLEPLVEIIEMELPAENSSSVIGWKLLFFLTIVSVIGWLIISAVEAVITGWNQSVIWGAALSLWSGILLGLFIWLIFSEWRASQRIDQFLERRDELAKAIENDELDKARELLQPFLIQIKLQRPELVQRFEDAAVKNTQSAKEYKQALEDIVLSELDKQVEIETRKAGLIGGAGAALIPHPALDAIFAVWRSTVLIRRIATIYGLAPTPLTSIKLLKFTLMSATIAAGVEELTSRILEGSYDSQLGVILKPLLDASATGMRLLRLGKIARMTFRPLIS